MANEYRVSTVGGEVLHDGDAGARVSTVGLEVLRATTTLTTLARVSTLGIEVLMSVSAGAVRRRQLVNN